MIKSSFTLVTAICVFSAITSCENPADKTTDAKVTSSKTVATTDKDAKQYTFTSDSSIKFTGSKAIGSHSGAFKSFEGGFQVVNSTPQSGSFTIQMNSVTSDSEKLTKHLTNADFFDVEKYPISEFVVTSFQKIDATHYTVSGNLKMLATSKNITFPATVNVTGDTVKLAAKFDINRKDWGIVYAGMADNLIKDEVILELDLTAKPAH